jgi:phosphatidylserine/phosphatidylglycerophosphate/cardiolipin synthase-like enzyme
MKFLPYVSLALFAFTPFAVSVLPAASPTGTAATATDTASDTQLVAHGFSPGNAETLVLGVINAAKKEIRMAAYVFNSRKIALALKAAKDRGVDIKILADMPQASHRERVRKLMVTHGFTYRLSAEYASMHNKFIVADGLIVQTGSFNYTLSAAKNNAENVVILRGKKVAASYKKEWQRLWDGAAK